MDTPSPKYLHQVIITENENPRQILPRSIQENIKSLIDCYPKSEYRLWNSIEIEKLLIKEFDPNILECFRSLKAFSSKCDLARLCILYVYGGLYSDIGLRFNCPIEPPAEFGMVAFQDIQNGAPLWCAMSNAIIWCRSHRQELKIAIDMIIYNWQERYYGPLPVYVSGPAVFGAAIVKAMGCLDFRANPFEFYIGHIVPIYPFTGNTSIFFVTPDRAVIATRQQSISKLQDKLLKTNSYGEIWQSKRAYGEKIISWLGTDPQIQPGPYGRRMESGIISTINSDGLVSFGPYTSIEPGRYQLRISLLQTQPIPSFKVEITCGANLIGYWDFNSETTQETGVYEMEFSVDSHSKEVEFRLFCYSTLQITLLGFTLCELA